MHADQIAAVERVRGVAGRKGVKVIPEWLCPPSTPDGDWSGHRVEDLDTTVMWRICPTTVPFIITGALAKWLDDQKLVIVPNGNPPMPLLDRLLAATNARLDELPDKENK